MRRYNPPPNWPPPPAGWTPPPGWKPEPSWGPPPPGWQLYVDDKAPAAAAAGAGGFHVPAGSWVQKKRWAIPIFGLVALTLLLLGVGVLGALAGDPVPAAAPVAPEASVTSSPEPSPGQDSQPSTPSTPPSTSPVPTADAAPAPAPEAPAETAQAPAPEPVPTGPGDPGVYAELAALTDCAALQEKFDVAANNNERETPGTPLFDITLSYMRYTDDRLEAVGCYE